MDEEEDWNPGEPDFENYGQRDLDDDFDPDPCPPCPWCGCDTGWDQVVCSACGETL